jgi:mRNA interferase ChpB
MDRGDIYLVDLEPTRGAEQRGRRPVMVITRAAFNKYNPPWVCPITAGGVGLRLAGFTVSLVGTGLRTTGVVLCSQVRTLDLKERRGKRIERAPGAIIDEVMAAVADVLE